MYNGFKMTERISIIIPTLNEEEHIGRCLKAVFRQRRDLIKEVIVADYNSTDRTRQICGDFDVRIVPGGAPSLARNSGAAEAQGELLLFLDADSVLPMGFLEKAVKRFREINPAVISFFLAPIPYRLSPAAVLTFYNYYSWLAARLNLPFFATSASCMMTTKANHDAVKGFDSEMAVLEEYEYVRCLKKRGRFRVIPLTFFTSMRRYNGLGAFRKGAALFIYYFNFLLGRKVHTDKYGYWK
jgi:glycosyltransferase involved in cell wall biosynthesis